MRVYIPIQMKKIIHQKQMTNDPTNIVNPSEDAEICIGYYE